MKQSLSCETHLLFYSRLIVTGFFIILHYCVINHAITDRKDRENTTLTAMVGYGPPQSTSTPTDNYHTIKRNTTRNHYENESTLRSLDAPGATSGVGDKHPRSFTLIRQSN